MKKTIIFTLVLISSLYLNGQKSENILIQNGTVITISGDVLKNTDILVENGKISKIAQGLTARKGTRIIDAKGKHIMPGIVDAHSHIGISNVNEATSPVTAEVWVGDAINPLDVSIYRALAGGVTVSHAMHGSANAIGGQCETMKHRYGTLDPEEMRMVGAPRTIKFALGENPMRVHGEGYSISPSTRMGVEQVFRNAFSQAKEYQKKWAEFRSGKTKYAPTYDLRMETVGDILDGEIIIHCHSYRADEILMLMNVCKDFGVTKLVFQHVNEGFKVAPELAAWGAGASVFSDWWAYKFEVYYSTAYNAAILTRNGVLTSINSDSGELIRHLYHEAAKSQKYGDLSDNEALKLITLNPAKQLGIADRVGSIEVGKDADLVIFNAHPLSIYAIPEMTIVDGVIRFDRASDPADMRLDIDPEASLPTFYEENKHDHDRCMEGVFEELFEEH